MPKVPRIQEGQRLAPQNPTGFQSTSQARLMGDAIKGVGTGLQNLASGIERARNANKTIVRRKTQYEVQSRIDAISDKYLDSDWTANDRSNFKKEADNIIKTVKKEMSDIYGDNYYAEIDISADEAGFDPVNKFEALDKKREIARMKKDAAEYDARVSAMAYNNPEGVVDLELEAVQTFSQALQTQGKTNEEIDAANKAVTYSIATNAFEGFLAKRKYKEAKAVITNSRYSHLFSTDEQTEKLDRARKIQEHDQDRSWKLGERKHKLEERRLKKASRDLTLNHYAQLQDAIENNDMAAVVALRSQTADYFRNKKVTLGNAGNILTNTHEAAKEIDASTKSSFYAALHKVGRSDKVPPGLQIEYLRNKLEELTQNEGILPATANDLNAQLRKHEDYITNNPRYRAEEKSATALLDRFILSETMFERLVGPDMLGQEQYEDYMAKRKGAVAYFNAMKIDYAMSGKPLEDLARETVAIFMPEKVFQTPPVAGVPVKAKEQSQTEYIEAVKKYYREEVILSGITERKRLVKGYIKALEIDKERLELIENFKKDVQGAEKEAKEVEGQKVIQRYMEDVDALKKPDAQGVPYIYRDAFSDFEDIYED